MKGIFLLLLLPLVAVNGSEFVESVHAQGAEIAKEMVIDGNQVIWSPVSVVNVLPLINGDQKLKESFKTSLTYIKELEGVKVKRLSAVYYADNTTVESVSELAADYEVEVIPKVSSGDVQVNDVLAAAYKKSIGVEPLPGFLPDSLDGTDQVYLTSLLLKGVWETPFRYAPKARFYMNETNAIKTKYMTNIGFFRYGEIDGVDARVLALPLKNTTTTFFVIILPNNYSGLPEVSQQFGKTQIGNLVGNLKVARTQLFIPKLDVDSQLLLQPKPSVKILQSGSMRLTYAGFDNHASRLKKSYHKHLRTRVNKKDIQYIVNHPFICIFYDTEVGILNYGEVLLPTTESVLPLRLKSEIVETRLSQNSKNFVDFYNELGNNLYQNLRLTREGSFVTSPVSIAHLLASYASGASTNVQQQWFSTLNSRDGILEAFNNIYYFNGTSSNSSTIVGYGATDDFKERLSGLGTQLVVGPDNERTQGISNYTFQTTLRSTKRFRKTFYLNEKDSVNSTFYEYIGRIKYVGLPYWDAKAFQVFVSPSQSLLIFSPNERSGLHVVEEGLKDFAVSKLLCQMVERYVRLRIPAFEVSYATDIYPELQQVLGGDEFRLEGLDDALLSGIYQNVSVSVEGNEDVAHRFRGSHHKTRKPSTRINLDRSFVFYLLDNTIGSLAIGRITSLPEAQVVVPVVPSTVLPDAPPSSVPSESSVPVPEVSTVEPVAVASSPSDSLVSP